MKLKQHLIIKQYFIDYSLGKYSGGEPTVPDYLVEELSQPDYENKLDITSIATQADGDIAVTFESEKVLTEPQIYTRNKPSLVGMFETDYINDNRYKDIKDVPLSINNRVLYITDGTTSDVTILVDREFAKKTESEQKKILIDIFKENSRVDFSTPEKITTTTFDLAKDSTWNKAKGELTITCAIFTGPVKVHNDDRRFELDDVHIGVLTMERPYTIQM